MTTTFDSVMIGSVIETDWGRYIKISNKKQQPNAQDVHDNSVSIPGAAHVTVLTSPVKMGKAFIKAYNAREANQQGTQQQAHLTAAA